MENALRWAKKHAKLLISLGVLLGLFLFVAGAGEKRNRIEISAVYDEQLQTIAVEQSIEYVNSTPLELDCVYLNLYPNAFAKEKTAPVLREDFVAAYPEGFSPGWAEVEEVCFYDEPAAWTLDGEQDTLLLLAPKTPLSPGQGTRIRLKYTLHLPRTTLRFGYSDRDVRLLNAFASPAWHDGDRWHLDAYTAVGDPFVSECADYAVTLRAPASFIAAGPGLQGGGEDGVWRFRADGARDFALVLSREYCVAQEESRGIRIRGFAFSQKDAQELARLGSRAAETFSGLFGRPGRRELLLCAGDFSVGGMETPGLVLLDESLLSQNRDMLEFVAAHETAHQWWYADVGSDQVNCPWQDEALTEYSTLLYFESQYGRETMDAMYHAMIRPALERSDLKGLHLNSPVTAFCTNELYDALVYKKGAAMFHDLRAQLGNDGFLAALREYHSRYAGAIAPPEALLEAFGGEASRRALEWLSGQR